MVTMAASVSSVNDGSLWSDEVVISGNDECQYYLLSSLQYLLMISASIVC